MGKKIITEDIFEQGTGRLLKTETKEIDIPEKSDIDKLVEYAKAKGWI